MKWAKFDHGIELRTEMTNCFCLVSGSRESCDSVHKNKGNRF